MSTVKSLTDHASVDLNTARHGEQWRLALRDLVEGAKAYHVWVITGWQDIKQRYKRSAIGPFWITLSLGITIAAMGVLYARLFHENVQEYIPYLSVGLILWALISSLITESCSAFIQTEGIIKQIRLPLTVHIFRMIWRNLIIFLHNAVVLVIVFLWFSVPWHWQMVFVPVGLLLIALNAVWLGLMLGALSARFRDIPQIVTSLTQVLFFITPVMWRPETLKTHLWIIQWNPVYHFIETVRGPLAGRLPTVHSLLFLMAFTAIGAALSIWFFAKYRARIAYWV